jgi:hypothetical protein
MSMELLACFTMGAIFAFVAVAALRGGGKDGRK